MLAASCWRITCRSEKTTSFSSPIAPDNHAAIVGAAGGSISNLKTTVAVTSKEALAAFKTAGDMAKRIQERRALTRFATALWADAARPAL